MSLRLDSILHRVKDLPLKLYDHITALFQPLKDNQSSIFAGMGALTVGYFGGKLLLWSLRELKWRLIPPNLPEIYGKGSWAVVTGASDGIGRAFCEELVKKGFNIILIARSASKLQNVVNALRQINKDVQTKIITADFTNSMRERFFTEILDDLDDFNISILVNNVGMETLEHFDQVPEQFLKEMTIVNTIPMVLLSENLIKKFEKRKGHRSAIINVSSISGLRPVPFFNTYSSTKAFSDFYTRALAQQKRNSNIDIISLRPGYVSTRMTALKKVSRDTITPNECAKHFLDQLGKEKETSGHWKHKILAAAIMNGPEIIYPFIVTRLLRKEMERRKRDRAGAPH